VSQGFTWSEILTDI